MCFITTLSHFKDDLTKDEKEFRKILSYVNDCKINREITDKPDMANQFGQGVFQYLDTLEERGWLHYNHQRQCYYIEDAGVEALETTLNPKYHFMQQRNLIAEEDLKKYLKHAYDDLLEVETQKEKDPSGFKNRLQVIYETVLDLEWKIDALVGLGEFGALPEFEPEYSKRGEAGMDQLLKSQIKALAVEIGLDLYQENSTGKSNSSEAPLKHKWTRDQKIAIIGIVVTIFGIVIALLV
jgi:hypothetical protein